jgi:uncharacterized repeat protein (TIGR01451 family)
MKKLYLFLFIAFSTLYTQAQNQPFITTWEVFPSNLSITIPTHPGSTYNYTVDFGDGTVLNNQTGNVTHSYSTEGNYTVSITGTFPRIYFNGNSLGNLYGNILSIDQWGDIQWQSMESAFKGPNNLIVIASDAPDLSQVTDLSSMFAMCLNFNQPINHWDVSNVTDMSEMFMNTGYNQPLNSWNVSNVTNMEKMFYISDFDQPLNNWDVSNVMNMKMMFANNPLNWYFFNQPLNTWDVSNVTNMEGMFLDNIEFNQPLNSWIVSNVTNMDYMFVGAKDFNQPLNSWDVSNVISMFRMFGSAESFNQPLNNWNTFNVTNMGDMFEGAINFNKNINNWNISNVINLKYMFAGATAFNQPLNSWNVSNINDMSGVFRDASSFNQPLDQWDVSNVDTFLHMFNGASSFNQSLTNWNLTTQWFDGFLNNSGVSVRNYDNFLSHLAALGIQQGYLGAIGIEYCNLSVRDELINNRGWYIFGDTQSQNCNSIIGTISYDENNNGCDPNDAGISGFMINANDGSDDIFTYSNNGTYELGAIGTNFTVSVMNYPNYFSLTPASQQVTFTSSNTEVADFCVTANQSIEDLNVVLIPISEARPGFEADYQLVVENIGTQIIANATVTLDFDDATQSFVNASVTSTSTTANQLTFDMANLQPLTFQTVDITMQTFQPPTVNGDDILSFTANVNPSANDFTPSDNTFVYDQTVVNSYDPNDKQVLQGEEIEIDDADEYLNYLIRFQNTGTASAINVRISDTLHPKLDYSTLRPVNASHDYRIEVTNENEVEFIFDGINLPDENTNEPASHGFVAYKIKPKSDVVVGDFITGDANIYFDFNAPIITNIVSTEIIDNLSSTTYELENGISIYPNPTQNILHIEIKNKQEIEQLKIYNLSGLELINIKENQQQLNLESLSTGVYFIQIQTNLGTVNKRFMKK